MEKRLQTLLQELYRLDPSLRSHEKTLKPLLQEVIATKPDIHIDPQFQKQLHTLIQKRTAESNEGAAVHNSFFNLFSMNKSFAGVALATLLIVPIAYNFLSAPSLHLPGTSITPVENEAFGSLTLMDQGGLGSGGGETVTTEDTKEMATVDTSNLLVSEETSIWMPVTVNYTYAGDPLVLDDARVDVIKRIVNDDMGQQFGDMFESMDLGLVDLSNFEDMKLTYLNLVPSDDEGYSVNIDFLSGAVSLYLYWTNGNQPRWMMEEWLPLSEADMLSDEELLTLAEDFVNEYSLPVELFGAPKVVPYDTSWGYYPDNVMVNYPLLINGESVYESYGVETGLNVNISLRDKQVNDVWGLQTQEYQSSSYEAATDSASILEVASRGGIYGFYYEEATQTVNVTLGTPTEGYLHTITYDATTGSSQELYVPALIFPVMDKPTSVEGVEYMPYIQDYVVVPLAAEILETAEEGAVIMF